MPSNELIYDDMSEKIIQTAQELAKQYGAKTLTVRRLLLELGVTNRVFYNRYHNIDEVLEIVYKRAVSQMHDSLKSEYDAQKNLFEYAMDVALKVLINTYDIKMQFSGYMFEHDSFTESNWKWWCEELEKIIAGAVENKIIKPVDPKMLSYTFWCFCRGFNADAVARKLSKEEATERFKFGFGCLLEGIKYR